MFLWFAFWFRILGRVYVSMLSILESLKKKYKHGQQPQPSTKQTRCSYKLKRIYVCVCVCVCVCVLGLMPLNAIVWCCVWYYVWLNIVINKFVLLLSEIMVTWIFEYYHIVHEMYSMWFMWKVTEDINHKFFVHSEL